MYRRRRYRRKRRYSNRRTGGWLGRELKFHDEDNELQLVGTAGLIVNASFINIAQGTKQSERIGRIMTMKSLHIRYHVLMDTQTSVIVNHDHIVLYVYLDRQCNGAAATPAQILDIVGKAQSFRNLENIQRFKILARREHTLHVTGASGDGTTQDLFFNEKFGKIDINLGALKVYFSGTTGALSEIKSNNIGFLCISEHGRLDFSYHARVRFTG